MKKLMKNIFTLVFVLIVPCCLLFSGCSFISQASVVSIEKTASNNAGDTYTIKYSNGTTSSLVIKNGKDGTNGDSFTAKDLFEEYQEQYPDEDLTYKDFLDAYLNINNADNSVIINQCLQSCLKVYSEFAVTSYTGLGPFQSTIKDISISAGSAIIYKMDENYTYVITNYHVVYSVSANEDNGGNIARRIVGYLYGSEDSPVRTNDKQNGYTVMEYGDYGIDFEYIGGSACSDIAVLRAETDNILSINENVKPVTLASDYHVGQTAIAIGNPEDEGISVTEGIISIDNEYIALSVDGTTREHRSLRIDTALYSGNSGGGLFNCYGELIGITNAGNSEDQNVNFSVPLEILQGVTDNIIYYYLDDNANTKDAYKILLGFGVQAVNSKYVLAPTSKYGEIIEEVLVSTIVDDGILDSLGIVLDSQIKSIIIDNKEYIINRTFDISDAILNIRVGSEIKIKYESNSTDYITSVYTVKQSDLVGLDAQTNY